MAAPRKHLRNAPIVEAVIDIQTRMRPGAEGGAIEQLAQALAARYSAPEPITMQQVSWQVGIVAPQIPLTTLLGWKLHSPDSGVVIQLRTNGFSFSKLPAYTSWPEVLDEAYPLWEQFRDASVPIEITRTAVRYINQLELPVAELARYLCAPPAIAPLPSPQGLSEYFTRTVVHDAERSAAVIVTQASSAVAKPGEMRLILDIDVFRQTTMDPLGLTREVLETLRDLKNEVFFASLTDEAIARYE